MTRFGPGFFAQNRRGVRRGAIGLALALAGLLGLVTSGIRTGLESSWAYSAAVPRAVADPRVRQALGEPIVPGWMVTGSVKSSGAEGRAHLRVPLEGAARTGQLDIEAHAAGNGWQLDTLTLAVEGAAAIDLLAP